MRIRKKTWKEGFERILSGEKTFDARLADFKCKKGDILILEEYDPIKKKYTGRKIKRPPGICIPERKCFLTVQ